MKRKIGVAGLQRRLALRQRGQVIVFVTLALFAVLGMAALAVDVGNLWTTRRQMQSAADAAAMAAADSIELTGGTADITSWAQAAAAQNGFTNGSTTTASTNPVTVAVYHPPQSGVDVGASNAVQVVISQQQPTYFMRVLGDSAVSVSTTATGVVMSSGSCVYALDPSSTGAITVSGGGTLTSQCGVYDNANLTVSGGGSITSPVVGVVGTSTLNGGGSTSTVTGIAAFGDPMSWVPEPTPAPCTNYSTLIINSSTTLSPGTYCGGIKINSTGITVNFNPGTYITDGGGLTVVAGATVNGSGVTFYLTGANKANSNPSSYGGVNIAGNSTVNLTAPCDSSNGGIPNMLFFQDRSETNGVSSAINGGSGSSFSGVMYFPTTTLNYAGNSAQDGYTVIISYDLNITGTTNIGNSYCSGGNPVQHASLVQ